ncbi:MAG: polyprenyl synthetase family protein [Verrucomicrobiota bacterium]
MYTLKTTRYTFELPCLMGAQIAGASEEQQDVIRKMTYPLGLAFQVDNDLQEFRRVDLKNSGFPDDLVEGKRTLLVAEAYQKLDEMDKSFLQMCLGSHERTEARLIKLYDLIMKSGALKSLQNRVKELFEESESHLNHPSIRPQTATAISKALQRLRGQLGVVHA